MERPQTTPVGQHQQTVEAARRAAQAAEAQPTENTVAAAGQAVVQMAMMRRG
jgi:hypothetical protein